MGDADRRVAGRPGRVLGSDHDGTGPLVEAAEPLARVERAGLRARLTNRFWAACLLTPMLRPISAHEAPERRAWSTKCPMRESATSPRCSANRMAPDSWSSGAACGAAIALIRSSRRTVAEGRHAVNIKLTMSHVNRWLTASQKRAGSV